MSFPVSTGVIAFWGHWWQKQGPREWYGAVPGAGGLLKSCAPESGRHGTACPGLWAWHWAAGDDRASEQYLQTLGLEPGVELSHPCGTPLTQDVLWFHKPNQPKPYPAPKSPEVIQMGWPLGIAGHFSPKLCCSALCAFPTCVQLSEPHQYPRRVEHFLHPFKFLSLLQRERCFARSQCALQRPQIIPSTWKVPLEKKEPPFLLHKNSPWP